MSAGHRPQDIVLIDSEFIIKDHDQDVMKDLKLVYDLIPPFRNKISILEPLGIALLGAKVGETVTYQTRDGKENSVSILKIIR